jgi:hypothetical protein
MTKSSKLMVMPIMTYPDSETLKDFTEKESEVNTDNNNIFDPKTASDEKNSGMDKDAEPNANNEEPEKIEDNEI